MKIAVAVERKTVQPVV